MPALRTSRTNHSPAHLSVVLAGSSLSRDRRPLQCSRSWCRPTAPQTPAKAGAQGRRVVSTEHRLVQNNKALTKLCNRWDVFPQGGAPKQDRLVQGEARRHQLRRGQLEDLSQGIATQNTMVHVIESRCTKAFSCALWVVSNTQETHRITTSSANPGLAAKMTLSHHAQCLSRNRTCIDTDPRGAHERHFIPGRTPKEELRWSCHAQCPSRNRTCIDTEPRGAHESY